MNKHHVSLALFILIMTMSALIPAVTAENGIPADTDPSDALTITGSIEDGSYILRFPIQENDFGEWIAEDISESGPVVKLDYSRLENGTFEARFNPAADGKAVVAVKHMNGVACDRIYTFDLLVEDGKILEVTGGSFTASPSDTELFVYFSGEWREQDTQFTVMTLSADDESVLTAEIVSPLTHGAYLFRMTLRYDCMMDAFVYNDSAAYELPITDSEEYVPGDPLLVGLEGCLMLKADENEQVLLVWHSPVTPDEADIVFSRLSGEDAGS